MKEGERISFMKKNEQINREQPGTGSLLMKTFGAMFFIVGLVIFGGWGLKKLGFGLNVAEKSENAPDLNILSTVSPKNGQNLSVVRFGERVLLVGSTAQSFTLLAEDVISEEIFGIDSSFETKHRSVAEMLAQDDADFEAELEAAAENIRISTGAEKR